MTHYVRLSNPGGDVGLLKSARHQHEITGELTIQIYITESTSLVAQHECGSTKSTNATALVSQKDKLKIMLPYRANYINVAISRISIHQNSETNGLTLGPREQN